MSEQSAYDLEGDGFEEGCPDCGQDTVVDTDDGGVNCTACGWRE